MHMNTCEEAILCSIIACVSVAITTQAGSNHLKAQADCCLKDVVLQNECINAAHDCMLAGDNGCYAEQEGKNLGW